MTATDCKVESSWNVMAHGDAREGKWRGNWRIEWVASTLHTSSEHGVSSITTADAHTSTASSWLNWRPRRFKWTRPFRRKTKSGFCACAITFQTQSTIRDCPHNTWTATFTAIWPLPISYSTWSESLPQFQPIVLFVSDYSHYWVWGRIIANVMSAVCVVINVNCASFITNTWRRMGVVEV